MPLADGANIIVGDNGAGKSTILEAIHLTLTGLFSGRYLRHELSQYLFNKSVEQRYLASLQQGQPIEPPEIEIELYLGGTEVDLLAELEGDGHSDGGKASGLKYTIEFNDDYASEYQELVATKQVHSLPIEYYRERLRTFARKDITIKAVPLKSALVDSARHRNQSGSDIYVSRIIRDNLEDGDRVKISQAHRRMKDTFMQEPSIVAINEKLETDADVQGKPITISVDLSTQNAWEASLMTYLGDIPFHFVGRGHQSVLKTHLALSQKRSKEANIILLEEPENHLTHTQLNALLLKVSETVKGKQIIASTHSSFVANKLGLTKLIFLRDQKTVSMADLSDDTQRFFRRLSGYDTLRLLLCKKAILVEGDSDELIVQRAYMDQNGGRLPIQDGIEVISVGTSFLRFLEIADVLGQPVAVVTDNDGDPDALKTKYANYLGTDKSHIRICYDKEVHTGNLVNGDKAFNYNTLEPALVRENGAERMASLLGLSSTEEDALHTYMRNNKTESALKIFESPERINFPQYILDAIRNE